MEKEKSTLTLLDLIAYAELFNGRYKNPPITDIFYDILRGMATLNFYNNVFNITFSKYEIRKYTTDSLESMFNDILTRIDSGEIQKKGYYDGFD